MGGEPQAVLVFKVKEGTGAAKNNMCLSLWGCGFFQE